MDAATTRRTLRFVDHVLALGRKYQSEKRNTEARRVFHRLSTNRNLPAEAAEEARQRLAELLVIDGEYKKARRHLAAVLTQEPNNPQYHYQMAQAITADENVDHMRALKHLHRATRLDSENAQYWCEYGLLALELGKQDAGLRAIRRALRLAADDPSVLEKALDGLTFLEHYDEARSVLRTARFRHPRDARFAKLWNDLHFQEILAEQQAARIRYELNENRPMLLPFDPAAPKRYRRDHASRLGSHHLGTTAEKKQIR